MALNINEKNYKELLAGDKPVVIDFWATWCGPCRIVSPIIDELATEYEGRAVIGKCDVEESNDLAMEYGIRSIPAVLFFKNGELVDKQIGSASKAVYADKLDKLL